MDIVLTMLDAYGRKTRKTFELKSSVTTLAAAQTALGNIITDIEAVSDANVSQAVIRDIHLYNVAGGGNIDEGIVAQFLMENGSKDVVRIPAPNKAALVSGTDVLDVTFQGWADFTANLLSAGDFRISEGESVDTLLSGYLEK